MRTCVQVFSVCSLALLSGSPSSHMKGSDTRSATRRSKTSRFGSGIFLLNPVQTRLSCVVGVWSCFGLRMVRDTLLPVQMWCRAYPSYPLFQLSNRPGVAPDIATTVSQRASVRGRRLSVVAASEICCDPRACLGAAAGIRERARVTLAAARV